MSRMQNYKYELKMACLCIWKYGLSGCFKLIICDATWRLKQRVLMQNDPYHLPIPFPLHKEAIYARWYLVFVTALMTPLAFLLQSQF